MLHKAREKPIAHEAREGEEKKDILEEKVQRCEVQGKRVKERDR